MRLFRVKSAALRESPSKSYSHKDQNTEQQFIEEIFETTSGILQLLESLLHVIDKVPFNDESFPVKIDLCELRQWLLDTRPDNILLGSLASVYSDKWFNDQLDVSNLGLDVLNRPIESDRICYSIHPEITSFNIHDVKTVFSRQFTDMNAFLIVAAREFKADLENIVKQCLYLVFFLEDVIETLVNRVLIFVLELRKLQKITENLTTAKNRLEKWRNESKISFLEGQIYSRKINQDTEFMRDIISAGDLTRLPFELMTVIEKSKQNLALLAQLQPTKQDINILGYCHNASCIYSELLKYVGRLDTHVFGADNSSVNDARKGLNSICDRVMVRYSAAMHNSSNLRDKLTQRKDRAKSADFASSRESLSASSPVIGASIPSHKLIGIMATIISNPLHCNFQILTAEPERIMLFPEY